MKTVTYHGPTDRLRLDGRYVPRGEPTELPNDIADRAKKRCGDRLTVHTPDPPKTPTPERTNEPANSGQEDES